jgi:hypothetical protein
MEEFQHEDLRRRSRHCTWKAATKCSVELFHKRHTPIDSFFFLQEFCMPNFIAANGPAGVAGAQIDDSFLKNKSTNDILNDVASGHVSQGGKMMAGEELQRRLDSGEIGKNLSPEEKEEVKTLLDSMKKGDLSPDGAERLQQLLQPSTTAGHDDGGIR